MDYSKQFDVPRIIELVMLAKSHREAAKALGMPEATLNRWLRRPIIKRRMAEAVDMIFHDAIKRLRVHAKKAVEVFAESLDLVDDKKLRLDAARHLMTIAAKMQELLDFDDRLKRLEDSRGVSSPPMGTGTLRLVGNGTR